MKRGWTQRTLGELTVNFDSQRVPVKELERKAGPYPYYGASGVVDHVHDYLFDGEYLLIAEDGENLRSRTTPIAFMARGKFWVNNHAHIVRGNDSADTRFLAYAIQNTDISGYLTGSTIPKLSQGSLNRIELSVPSLEEQREIASILGALDDKIELNRLMNATLEAMAQAVFKEWFVARNAPGGAKEEWEVKTIGEEFDIVMGQSPPGDTYNESGEGLPFFQGRTDFGFRFPAPRVHCTVPTRLAKEGDTLVSVRAPVGSINMADRDCAIGRGVASIRHKSGACSYTYHLMHSLKTQFELFESGGTVFGSMNKKDFHGIKFQKPRPDRIDAFERLVGPFDERVAINERETRTLAALRDTLLPKLMRGEVRVKKYQLT